MRAASPSTTGRAPALRVAARTGRRHWTGSRRSGRAAGRRRARTRSTGRGTGRAYTRSTPLRRPYPGPCTWAASSPTRTPTSSPVSSGCAARRCSTRWGGTTTGCPPSAACRTTSRSAATRHSPSTRRSIRPGSGRRSPGATSSSCASGRRPRTRRRTSTSGAGSGCRWTGPTSTRRSGGTPGWPASARSCATWRASRPISPRRRRCGTRRTRRRWLRPSWRTGTGPALLPACVALVCHPSDERYSGLVGTSVRSPLFNVDTPVFAHPLADPDEGTGIAMVCTFGDVTDVTWWRDLRLPARTVVGRDGRLLPDPPSGVDGAVYAELAGRTVAQARRRIVELLSASGDLVGEPRPITHPVKFYEKGELPLEIVTSRQWYLTNGSRDPSLQAQLIERGRELRWVPEHMRHRYEHWVTGLTGDWLISRQRFFGVPIPVWYPLDADGAPDYDRPLVPDEARLPVDPASETPDGYAESQRGRPGGFAADPDVMDTWATSSLTPQIAGRWERDPDLFQRVYPMDLRPQAHEIIRTWLFVTVLRSHLELGVLPWRTARSEEHTSELQSRVDLVCRL